MAYAIKNVWILQDRIVAGVKWIISYRRTRKPAKRMVNYNNLGVWVIAHILFIFILNFIKTRIFLWNLGRAKILFSTKNEIIELYLMKKNEVELFSELKFLKHLISIAVNNEHIYFSKLKDDNEIISRNTLIAQDVVTVGKWI